MTAGETEAAAQHAKRITVLGSTGSVGVQTLEVAAEFPRRFRVAALAAGRQTQKLLEQTRRFKPELISLRDESAAAEIRAQLQRELGAAAPEVCAGDAGLQAVAQHPAHTVVAAIVGAAGLRPVLCAARQGRTIALANKEALVMAGALLLRETRAHGAALLPVDSEHSAVFQALAGQRRADVARIWLTASGGPFREWPAARIAKATRADALQHPTWRMGEKITVDSATLMNKALEVIEARWLFDAAPEQIKVVVHPQSIVHSLVEFCDGAQLAQLGAPDMRAPLAYALAFPQRLPLNAPRLNLAQTGALTFEAPDTRRFPALKLAWRALAADAPESAPAALNAANEIAVRAFLAGEIPFPRISEINAAVLLRHIKQAEQKSAADLDSIFRADENARARAAQLITGDADV